METLFENNEFRLLSTGLDYDFVGIIETKTDKPLTFFFSEVLVPYEESDEEDWDSYDYEANIDESETCLMDVYEGLKPYDEESGDPFNDEDDEQDIAMMIGATSYFRTRDDKSTGFLSDPQGRGQFLALVKNYCPEQLKNIAWA